MTREDIIRMAREQGLPETEVEGVFRVNSDDLCRLLAAEREACAKVCDVLAVHPEYASDITKLAALAIRARKGNE